MRASSGLGAGLFCLAVLAGCSSAATEPTVSGPAPTEVFSFASDDLCDWVTEEKVADIVAAEFDWDGTAASVSAPDPTACRWELLNTDGSAFGEVRVGNAALWRDFDDNLYDPEAQILRSGVTEYKGPVDIGAWVAGHPALSPGAVVHNGGFGQFMFGVPPDTEWLEVYLLVPGFDDEWVGGVASVDYEARFFTVADDLLEELGWLTQQG